MLRRGAVDPRLPRDTARLRPPGQGLPGRPRSRPSPGSVPERSQILPAPPGRSSLAAEASGGDHVRAGLDPVGDDRVIEGLERGTGEALAQRFGLTPRQLGDRRDTLERFVMSRDLVYPLGRNPTPAKNVGEKRTNVGHALRSAKRHDQHHGKFGNLKAAEDRPPDDVTHHDLVHDEAHHPHEDRAPAVGEGAEQAFEALCGGLGRHGITTRRDDRPSSAFPWREGPWLRSP